MSTFGQRLRAARLEAGMTLQEVADAVGVKNSTVCRYEQDEIRNRKAPVVKAFAEVLSIRVSDLEACGTKSAKEVCTAQVLSENLKQLLKDTGKTMSNVSKDLGISFTTISDWVNGRKYPRPENLDRLSGYFGVPVTWLISLEEPAAYQTDDPEEPAEPRDPTGVSPLGKRIMYRREWLRMSQSELALMTGLPNRESVAKIESGKNQIPVDKVRAFADALKVPVHELIDCNDAEWATFCKVWKLLNE